MGYSPKQRKIKTKNSRSRTLSLNVDDENYNFVTNYAKKNGLTISFILDESLKLYFDNVERAEKK